MYITLLLFPALVLSVCTLITQRVDCPNDRYDLHMITKPLSKYRITALYYPKIITEHNLDDQISIKNDLLLKSLPLKEVDDKTDNISENKEKNPKNLQHTEPWRRAMLIKKLKIKKTLKI